MSLTAEDVNKIAHLARLAISDQDIPHYVRNLSNILTFVEQLNGVNTTGVTPLAHPQDMCQRLREDKIAERDQRDDYQRLAPDTEAGLYLVPKVIE